jgi:hypothetical protein
VRRPTFTSAVRRLSIVTVGCILASSLILAQRAPGPAPQPGRDPRTVEIDPIRCWARSSVGAVRIGERFTVTLTCAVLETEPVQVVPDESKLGPNVVQMNPFEVVDGSHPPDQHTGSRRFFQYDYVLRMINPDSIGQDVAIPLLPVSYRVNSRIAANQQMQGRELSYVLPPMWVKIASLVPADATDIRDTAAASFNRIESMAFRAGVLQLVAGTLVALGTIMTLLALIGLARRARQRIGEPQEKLLSRPALMGLAVRELAAVQRDGTSSGWSDVSISRAASALRIAAAGILGAPISQRPAANGVNPGNGRFIVSRLGRSKRTEVSASVTAEDLARALERLPEDSTRRPLLEGLRSALVALSAALYARPGADRSGVDATIEQSLGFARQVRSELSWPREWLRRHSARTPLVHRQA